MNALLNPQARYDGAGQGRRLAGWNPPATGPQAATTPALPVLRNRIRDLVRNDAIAASAVRVLTNSIVGFGIQCRTNTKDPAQKARINDLWSAWALQAATDGGDFYSLQALIVRALVTDGEAFIRIRARKPEDGLAVPLQLEALESDFLPLLDTDVHPGLADGHVIRQGIEFDKINRRVAYWFNTQHPGEVNPFVGAANTDLTRVPAESVLHIFEPQRIGQIRGVSPFASVVAKLRNVADYDDAVTERVKLANLFVAFLKKPVASGNADPMTGQTFEGTLADPISGLEPGLMQELLPGEDVTFSAPPDAGATYADFMRTQHLIIAAALGVPVEMLTGELRDISDRSLRFAVGEFRRRVDQIVWTVLVPRFLQPAREAFAKYAALSGALAPADANAARRCTWSPPAQPYIHPTQDVQARKMEVDAGFRSRASVIAERGDDPELVDAERAADKARAESLDLLTADEEKTAAEVAKLRAEADAAEKAAAEATASAAAARARASEATASAAALKAQQATAEAIRVHEVQAAADRAKVARLESQAAEIGLRELTGGKIK